MTRVLVAASLLLAVVDAAIAWPLPFGPATGNRVARGTGTFPRRQWLALATDTPVRWLVALPSSRLASVDEQGAFAVFEIAARGLRLIARYGSVASPESSAVALRIDQDHVGAAVIAPDGRLLIWSDGALRGYDVGTPLSPLTFPTPVAADSADSQALLAIAKDGAVVLIGGIAAGVPRVVARVEARALPDARITVADLDGDGAPDAVVLTDPTSRNRQAGDRLSAAGLTILRVQPLGLEIRTRMLLPPPAVLEGRAAVLGPVAGHPNTAVWLSRTLVGQGTGGLAFGLRHGTPVVVAEAASSQSAGPVHFVGAVDLSGDGVPEAVAVADGVLTAYRRAGGALVAVATSRGWASLDGARTADQALVADLDGNGVREVVTPRRGRESIVGAELRAGRFAERWAVDLKARISSNLVAADLDGDGLLDLALATTRGVHVFVSTP